MSKHTPGPWTFDGKNEITTSNGELLLMVGVRVPLCGGAANDEARANAKLIAAVPDLLAALKAMVEVYKPDYLPGPWIGEERKNGIIVWTAAQDAIRKAES